VKIYNSTTLKIGDDNKPPQTTTDKHEENSLIDGSSEMIEEQDPIHFYDFKTFLKNNWKIFTMALFLFLIGISLIVVTIVFLIIDSDRSFSRTATLLIVGCLLVLPGSYVFVCLRNNANKNFFTIPLFS
jgi:hypothetical protein